MDRTCGFDDGLNGDLSSALYADVDQSGRTRVMIIQSIQESMKAEGVKVEIDPNTGDISIAENILFPYGSAQLSTQGKVF